MQKAFNKYAGKIVNIAQFDDARDLVTVSLSGKTAWIFAHLSASFNGSVALASRKNDSQKADFYVRRGAGYIRREDLPYTDAFKNRPFAPAAEDSFFEASGLLNDIKKAFGSATAKLYAACIDICNDYAPELNAEKMNPARGYIMQMNGMRGLKLWID